jgi:2-methylaconitate cis-trans-isomerase PrpF
MRSILLTVVGAFAIEAGLVYSPWPWTAAVVGGAIALAFGLFTDDGGSEK